MDAFVHRDGVVRDDVRRRKWTYSQAGLAIRDHHAQILAQLTPAGSNRFEGKTSAGQDVALSR